MTSSSMLKRTHTEEDAAFAKKLQKHLDDEIEQQIEKDSAYAKQIQTMLDDSKNEANTSKPDAIQHQFRLDEELARIMEAEELGDASGTTTRNSSSSSLDTDDRLPSTVINDYWIWAYTKDLDQLAKGLGKRQDEGGKWMIFANISQIDEYWVTIRNATREGKLGRVSKVATARDPLNRKSKVICVYFDDENDQEEIQRIKQALADLGFARVIFKTNLATALGIYHPQNDLNRIRLRSS